MAKSVQMARSAWRCNQRFVVMYRETADGVKRVAQRDLPSSRYLRRHAQRHGRGE